jgi:ribosomal protein S18 acetylase RimI-like enzyme
LDKLASHAFRGCADRLRVPPVRDGDLRAVLAIERQAFPDDPWTLDAAGGRLARAPLGGHGRGAVWFARLIGFARLTEAVLSARLACAVLLRRQAARHYVVAEADGVVRGYGYLNAAAAASGEIQAIAVRGDREGRGIGTALLAGLIATAADLGCSDVVLCVRANNTRARELRLPLARHLPGGGSASTRSSLAEVCRRVASPSRQSISSRIAAH